MVLIKWVFISKCYYYLSTIEIWAPRLLSIISQIMNKGTKEVHRCYHQLADLRLYITGFTKSTADFHKWLGWCLGWLTQAVVINIYLLTCWHKFYYLYFSTGFVGVLWGTIIWYLPFLLLSLALLHLLCLWLYCYYVCVMSM